MRSALGAARGRLIRQFLTEAFLLSLLGGGLGVLGALGGVAGLVALAPANLPRRRAVSVSIPVLAFALLLSTAIAAGLGALTAARVNVGESAREASRKAGAPSGVAGQQRVAGSSWRRRLPSQWCSWRSGVFGRSLMKVLEVNRLFAWIRLSRWTSRSVVGAIPRPRQVRRFLCKPDRRLATVPGVRAVGAASGCRWTAGLPDGMFVLMTQSECEDQDGLGALFQQKGRTGNADFCVATDGYFRVSGFR